MEKYPRNGTDVDAAAITSVFQEMGFITEEHHNLSVYEMRKVRFFVYFWKAFVF